MKPSLGISTACYCCCCFVLLISTFKFSYGKPNCSEEAFNACLKMLEKVGQSTEMAFATTMVELNQACRPLRQGIACVDNFMNHCITPAERKLFNSVVAGSRQAMNDLCIHGKMQTEYLRHAACIKNVSTDPKRCAPSYQKMVQYTDSLKQNSPDDKDVKLRQHCCAMTEFIKCQNIYTTQDCGADASHFLQKHTEKMSGSLIHQHCIVFTYGSNSCQEAELSAASSISSQIIIVISTIISYYITFMTSMA